MMNSGEARAARQVVSFSSFRLDLLAGRLLHGDEAIPLRPKTWSVLVYLALRPGVLVSRDELLDAIWPDVAVTPDTLTKSIGEIRAALGDSARPPSFIETVHRRGFRFVAARGEAAGDLASRDAGGTQTAARPFVGRAA
jgi:DNA-binding winged helix-turn-helix (wHTH) protein